MAEKTVEKSYTARYNEMLDESAKPLIEKAKRLRDSVCPEGYEYVTNVPLTEIDSTSNKPMTEVLEKRGYKLVDKAWSGFGEPINSSRGVYKKIGSTLE